MSEFCPNCGTDNYCSESYDGGEAMNYEGELYRMSCNYCGYGSDDEFETADEYIDEEK